MRGEPARPSLWSLRAYTSPPAAASPCLLSTPRSLESKTNSINMVNQSLWSINQADHAEREQCGGSSPARIPQHLRLPADPEPGHGRDAHLAPAPTLARAHRSSLHRYFPPVLLTFELYVSTQLFKFDLPRFFLFISMDAA